MEIINTDTFLLSEVENSIVKLKSKVDCLKRKTKIINILTLLLGASITVTLGLTISGYQEYQRNLALCFGAILTAVNGWNVIFDYKKLWIRQKSTLLHLYQLKNDICFSQSVGQMSHDKQLELFERYQNIWEDNGSEWRNINRTSSRNSTSSKNSDD
ncbi:SLATT domain-containing protein [Providencia huaxiensis]|uniref:SLATT domain-containing protein n=1 Tax=Providencia TaxID=586 RepID=UPI001B39C0D1|nr:MULTISPECIES: SLATT domain-containing protein [Providencia]EJD6370311.1 SLATT domain-containing protein [Providencia rettgeri]EJD6374823.1 SLATT domain-containing protein [Providencia rettgeri]ELR5033163.1 SLATT domain-containing protein [Providencia rettgeri]ELR5159927.1 SLATT domain-containing protein [Providencia rettgeri]ELR5208995.1 SLATT domain-containing protein [Providencia rettgeri]